MSAETQDIKQVWANSEDTLGYASGRAIGSDLHKAGILAPEEAEYAGRFIDHQPTRPFLYEGAEETVRTLINEPAGNNVLVWTQGEPRQQILKVASSGILGLRRDPEFPEGRTGLKVYAHVDKVADLGNVISDEHMPGRRVVIVDDKSKNVLKAQQKVQQLKEEGRVSEDRDVTVVWINQGRTKDQVPEGFTPETFKEIYPAIDDIRELPNLFSDTTNTSFLLDWDHTLCNTGEWRKKSQGDIAEKLSRHAIVSPFIDETVGIGEATIEEVYTNGHSGSGVKRVVQPSGEQLVVKCRLHDRSRLMREHGGHRIVEESPLAHHVLPVDTRFLHRGVLIMPYYHGVSMREGIKDRTIDADLAIATFHELLALKAEWWKGQELQSPEGVKSMQRTEWIDTVTHLRDSVLPELAQATNTSVDMFTSQEMIHNGVHIPSIGETLAFMDSYFTTTDTVPYTVNAHNDATGANIVIGDDGDWRLFDYEWAGPNDPAEALARMTKQISTATISQIQATAEQGENGLHVETTADVPELAIQLDSIGKNAVVGMQGILGDDTLADRTRTYLVGSYLREAALSNKRGGTPAALFALTSASRLMAHYDITQ